MIADQSCVSKRIIGLGTSKSSMQYKIWMMMNLNEHLIDSPICRAPEHARSPYQVDMDA